MFYKTKIKDFVRVAPDKFKLDLKQALTQEIKLKYEGHISKEIGTVIDVTQIDSIGEGRIIPGDGATFYEAEFTLLTFLPENKEVVMGTIKDIADFGAFLNLGPTDGMIHISQTMNDYVSFSKEKSLLGKESNKSLKIGDNCRARVVSVSFKDLNNPKIGLTMRQEGLGKQEWVEEDLKKGGAKDGQ